VAWCLWLDGCTSEDISQARGNMPRLQLLRPPAVAYHLPRLHVLRV